MAQYRVISLSVGGLRNKIYHSGEIVSSECWRDGRAAELAAQGFLELIPEGRVIKQETGEMDDGVQLGEGINLSEIKPIDDYTANEIKGILDERGVGYKTNESKADLYKKLIA